MRKASKRRRKAPGKSHRQGISLLELSDLFPNERAATEWFETVRWPGKDRPCPRCGDCNTYETKTRKPMPYWCRGCKRYFSVLTGTSLERSHIPIRKWCYGIYLWMTNLKGVSSMKLHRDLGITQKSAWFMAHRLRDAFSNNGGIFAGPVEVDETYMGGKRRNMSYKRREKFKGRGSLGKTAVVGIKDRNSNRVKAKVVEDTTAPTLQGFVLDNTRRRAKIYSDDSRAYLSLENHESVKHSVGEYVRGMAHTNGIESFWSMLKRAYAGTFHTMSPKHLQKYVDEFSARHNLRNLDTIDQMRVLVMAVVGRRLMYRDLIQ